LQSSSIFKNRSLSTNGRYITEIKTRKRKTKRKESWGSAKKRINPQEGRSALRRGSDLSFLTRERRRDDETLDTREYVGSQKIAMKPSITNADEGEK